MSDPRDDYLWDRTGAPDRETAELERLLGRFAHDGRPLAEGARGGRPLRPVLFAAAAVAVAVGAWAWLGPRGDERDAGAPALVAGAQRLGVDEWFTATETDNKLAIGDVGDLTLEPGSRLQVRRVGADETRLYLERGHMHAFVDATVRPRFFQVDTPSARCVDLGCMYDLRVDDEGTAHVEVSLGQIAFELGERDVYVPRGAECTATKERGLGTPHFSDCDPTIAQLVSLLDSEPDPDRRAEYAEKLVSTISEPRDTLTLWHLLRDADARVAAEAERRLVEIAGHPDAEPGLKIEDPRPVDAETWRAHLDFAWW